MRKAASPGTAFAALRACGELPVQQPGMPDSSMPANPTSVQSLQFLTCSPRAAATDGRPPVPTLLSFSVLSTPQHPLSLRPADALCRCRCRMVHEQAMHHLSSKQLTRYLLQGIGVVAVLYIAAGFAYGQYTRVKQWCSKTPVRRHRHRPAPPPLCCRPH